MVTNHEPSLPADSEPSVHLNEAQAMQHAWSWLKVLAGQVKFA